MSEKLYTVEQAEMLVERNLLTDKIVKLNEILNTGNSVNLYSDHEWDLMNLQASSMRSYNNVLCLRINLFNK